MQIIAAISTPIGVGAIAIVRMSGEGCLALAQKHFSAKSLVDAPTPNHLYLGHFASDGFAEQCFLVYFATPHSYTGEEMVELQIHGGVAVARLVLDALLSDGARLAHAGEFTRRAFLNGKISLSQAEGIAGVIAAQSKSAVNMSYQLLQGSVRARIAPILQQLQLLLATLEASFDYPDEMEGQVQMQFDKIVHDTLDELQALAATAHNGKMAKDGISVAIVGRPNAGKSSLLNCILHEERAIVTPIAGTTRDTICESVLVDGVRLNLLDTAGLRETQDEVERMGVFRAKEAAQKADAVIYLLDSTRQDRPDEDFVSTLTGKLFVVYNKADIGNVPQDQTGICAKTGDGVDALLQTIASMAQGISTEGGVLCEQRHIHAVDTASQHLQQALRSYGQVPLDCTALSIRAAYLALGEVDGGTATEEVLDSVFSRFCVGK